VRADAQSLVDPAPGACVPTRPEPGPADTVENDVVSTLIFLGALLLTVALGLSANRIKKEGRAAALARRLQGEGATALPFEPSMLDGVPEPARRYLARAIAPGTLLATSVRLGLEGSIRLSADGPPARMTSEEVLAPARGFVWSGRVRAGMLPIRGYDLYADGKGEMLWWLAGLLPVVRVSGPDFDRSAIGRFVGEAVLVPSMLLPGAGVRWDAVSEGAATVRRTVDGEEVACKLRIDPEGRLTEAELPRWNGDGSNGPIGYLPFRVRFSGGERTFDGYTIPARFEAGWHPEGGTFEPFFEAQVTQAEYRP